MRGKLYFRHTVCAQRLLSPAGNPKNNFLLPENSGVWLDLNDIFIFLVGK